MGRLIIGATAIVTGVAAALGMVLRRRRSRRDDGLPLDPAPPLWSSASAAHEPPPAPSIEADFGPVDPPGDSAPSPKAATRKPPTARKPSTTKRATTSKTKSTASARGPADPAAKPAVRPKRPTRVRTSPAVTNVAESIEPATGAEADPGDGS